MSLKHWRQLCSCGALISCCSPSGNCYRAIDKVVENGCRECSFREHMLKPNADPRTDHPNND